MPRTWVLLRSRLMSASPQQPAGIWVGYWGLWALPPICVESFNAPPASLLLILLLLFVAHQHKRTTSYSSRATAPGHRAPLFQTQGTNLVQIEHVFGPGPDTIARLSGRRGDLHRDCRPKFSISPILAAALTLIY